MYTPVMRHPLSPEASRPLRRAILSSAAGRSAHRLHAVLLVCRGLSRRQAAALIGSSPRAVSYWVRRYQEDSIEGLREKSHPGRRPRLPAQARAELLVALSASPPAPPPAPGRWTGSSLRRHLERAHGVSLSVRQCQRLLRGVAVLRPR